MNRDGADRGGELNLNGTFFELDTSNRQSAFYIFDDDEEGLAYSVDCSFTKNDYGQERVTPGLNLGTIGTSARTIEDLAGMTFEVGSIREADEREDLFYLFEHEPIVDYKLAVSEISNGRAHITCRGTAVEDGYADPYTTVPFEIDCWLPIIADKSDWEKYDL